MKKILGLLTVLTATVFMATSAFADVNIVKSAFASFSEVALVFDVNLYEWQSGKDYITYTGTGADSIAFDVSGVTLGNETPQWAGGTVFAKIHSNLSIQQGGTTVYMYTKNAIATGDYKANAPRTETWEATTVSLYSGLVRKGNTTTYQAGDYAPLYVKCKKISDANESYKSALPADFSGEQHYDGSRILADYSDSNFSTLADLARVIGTSGTNGGIWVGYGGEPAANWYSGSEDVIMFFGANFDHVIAGSEYGTTTINFVQTIE